MKVNNTITPEDSYQLAALRMDDVKYGEVKKKELWRLLHLVLKYPALGMVDDGDDVSFHKELRRIINIYMSPEGLEAEGAINHMATHLKYDTLVCLNQFVHNHLSAVAEAFDLLEEKPGQVEHMTDRLQQIQKDVVDKKQEFSEAKIELSASMVVLMLNLLSRLATEAEDIMSIADSK